MPTAILWDNKNTKMEHKKLLIPVAIISVFSFFVFCPAMGWASKRKKHTNMRGRFVDYLTSKSLAPQFEI